MAERHYFDPLNSSSQGELFIRAEALKAAILFIEHRGKALIDLKINLYDLAKEFEEHIRGDNQSASTDPSV